MREFTPIRALNDDEKPREKLISKGSKSLSNAELLAILISSGNVKKSALDLARDILQRAGNDLQTLARWNMNDFRKIEGIGQVKALTILSAIELAARKNAADGRESTNIGSSKDAYRFMRHHLEDLCHEEFWIMTLNRKNAVIAEHRISEGGITATIVDQRKIFRFALDDRSTGIILFHNHPSGNHQPSSADDSLTKKLSEAGKLLDINVLDHLIITQNAYYSYADEGKL